MQVLRNIENNLEAFCCYAICKRNYIIGLSIITYAVKQSNWYSTFSLNYFLRGHISLPLYDSVNGFLIGASPLCASTE